MNDSPDGMPVQRARVYCPLSECKWDFTFALETTAPMVVEKAIQAHVSHHTPLEWVTEIHNLRKLVPSGGVVHSVEVSRVITMEEQLYSGAVWKRLRVEGMDKLLALHPCGELNTPTISFTKRSEADTDQFISGPHEHLKYIITASMMCPAHCTEG